MLIKPPQSLSSAKDQSTVSDMGNDTDIEDIPLAQVTKVQLLMQELKPTEMKLVIVRKFFCLHLQNVKSTGINMNTSRVRVSQTSVA